MNPQSLDVWGTHQLWTISRDMKSSPVESTGISPMDLRAFSCFGTLKVTVSFPPKRSGTLKKTWIFGENIMNIHEYTIYTILENTQFHGHIFVGAKLGATDIFVVDAGCHGPSSWDLYRRTEVSINGGDPNSGWLISGKIPKWMMNRGTPILGNHHIYIYIHKYIYIYK